MADCVGIVVVDRHPIFRRGLMNVLHEADPAWRCTEAELAELKHELNVAGPSVVVLDLHLPGLGGIEGLGSLCARHRQHRFLAVSERDDPDAILATLRAGAFGYVLCGASAAQMARAVACVAAGSVFAPASLAGTSAAFPAPAPVAVPHSVANLARAGFRAPVPQLTRRQQEVLELLAEGCATKTIARRLQLGVGTVKIHLAAIYRALGASSRLEAVAKVRQQPPSAHAP
jgi:DNA-binding NarL/FixJ family response regulator